MPAEAASAMDVIAILLAISLATVVTVPLWGELYMPGTAEPDNRRAGD